MNPMTLEEKRINDYVPYYNVIGNLVYAIMCKKLNICYVVRIVRSYKENPKIMLWKVVMIILWYLEDTMYFSCCYQDKELNLIDYPDANWVCDLAACKLTSG